MQSWQLPAEREREKLKSSSQTNIFWRSISHESGSFFFLFLTCQNNRKKVQKNIFIVCRSSFFCVVGSEEDSMENYYWLSAILFT